MNNELQKNISIYTESPQNEIWNFLTDFESKQFVEKFVKQRVNILASRDRGREYKFIQEEDLSDIFPEVCNNSKQARDFFFLSKQLPLLSKPVMLFYAFEKLTRMLVFSTFKMGSKEGSINKDISRHGLTYFSSISIKQFGLFSLLHDCISTDRTIYDNEFEFSFEDILSLGPLNYPRLSHDIYKGSDNYQLKDSKSKNITMIKEIERQFIFIFALSVYSRYKVVDWEAILSGDANNLIARIRRYLDTVELLFPNLILNSLYSKRIAFFSPARIGGMDGLITWAVNSNIQQELLNTVMLYLAPRERIFRTDKSLSNNILSPNNVSK